MRLWEDWFLGGFLLALEVDEGLGFLLEDEMFLLDLIFLFELILFLDLIL